MEKNLPAKAGDIKDVGSILGSGRSRAERNYNPLQYSCLENPMDRGAWWATVLGLQSQTRLKPLGMHADLPTWHSGRENWLCAQLDVGGPPGHGGGRPAPGQTGEARARAPAILQRMGSGLCQAGLPTGPRKAPSPGRQGAAPGGSTFPSGSRDVSPLSAELAVAGMRWLEGAGV